MLFCEKQFFESEVSYMKNLITKFLNLEPDDIQNIDVFSQDNQVFALITLTKNSTLVRNVVSLRSEFMIITNAQSPMQSLMVLIPLLFITKDVIFVLLVRSPL